MKSAKYITVGGILLAMSGWVLAEQYNSETQIRRAEKSIFNEGGEIRYRVYLNPFFTASLESHAAKAGYVLTDSRRAKLGDPEIEKPEVRFAADAIAARIGKSPVKVLSWVGTYFEINARPEDIKELIGVEGVIDIAEVDGKESEATFSQSTIIASGDYYSLGEIVPWWKGYTNTDDANDYTNSQNILHVLDGPLQPPISDDLNIRANHFRDGITNPLYWGFWHAAHVDGVIGAKRNGKLIRGINPGQPIIHYGHGLNYSTTVELLNKIYADTEESNAWAAINMSFNVDKDTPSENPYEFSNDVGRAISIVSNRNIVLQSAGNHNKPACNKGYGFNNTTPEWDAIMMVGGHDINGQMSTDDYIIFNHQDYAGTVPGSNYGPCVELWAPSKQITSIRYNTETTQVLSGTSFAAPIAAAIALRYGDSQTRPLEREWFLKKSARPTGYDDTSNRPINSVKWTTNPDKLVRHNIQSIWSPQTTTNIATLYNGKYSDMWNAGGEIGSLVIDLGSYKTVKFIRVTPRSSVGLTQEYPVYFWTSPAFDPTGTITGVYQNYQVPKHGDKAPITIPLNDFTTRYIVLITENTGSWVAYSEVEVYGK